MSVVSYRCEGMDLSPRDLPCVAHFDHGPIRPDVAESFLSESPFSTRTAATYPLRPRRLTKLSVKLPL